MKGKTFLELLTLSTSLYAISKETHLLEKLEHLKDQSKDKINSFVKEKVLDDDGNEIEFLEKLSMKAHEAKVELTQWWSEVLESNLFYGLPMEWHRMCYELGQYYTAQNKISSIYKAAKMMDSSDKYVETLKALMTENYIKEAEPHETAYFYHLSSITANMTEFLEQSAEAYAVRNKQGIDAYFSRQLHEKLEAGHVLEMS